MQQPKMWEKKKQNEKKGWSHGSLVSFCLTFNFLGFGWWFPSFSPVCWTGCSATSNPHPHSSSPSLLSCYLSICVSCPFVHPQQQPPSHLSRRLFVRPSDATRLQSEGSEAKESLLRESDKKDEEKEWIEGINISTCGDIWPQRPVKYNHTHREQGQELVRIVQKIVELRRKEAEQWRHLTWCVFTTFKKGKMRSHCKFNDRIFRPNLFEFY